MDSYIKITLTLWQKLCLIGSSLAFYLRFFPLCVVYSLIECPLWLLRGGKNRRSKAWYQLVKMRTGVLKSQFSELNGKTDRCNHTSVYWSVRE